MVSPWGGWWEPCGLWTLLVGAPSSNKTPALTPITSALGRVETHEGAGFADTRRDHRTKVAEAKAVATLWEKRVHEAAKKAEPTPPCPPDAEEPPEPTPPRLVVSDTTIEALAPLLAANPRGLVLYRDELAGWLGNFGKYGGDGDAARFLECYNGGRITVDRVARGNTTVEAALLSIMGGIQPQRLNELLFQRTDDGLAARFLFTWPEPVARRRPTQGADLSRLDGALARLRALSVAEVDEGQFAPKLLRLDTTAASRFEAWWKANGKVCAAASAGLFAGWLGKGPGVVLRLACALTHLDWADAGGPEPEFVGDAAVARAVALFDGYLTPMAERVFGDAARPVVERHAAALLNRWTQERARQFNVRAYTRGPNKLDGLANAAALNPVLELLEERGWVRDIGEREGGTVGRRSRDYALHPFLQAE